MAENNKYWRVERDMLDGVATLIFDNPPANTLSFAAQDRLIQCLDEISESSDIRVVILKSGVTGFYCSGAEITELDSLFDATRARDIVTRLHSMFAKLENLPQITIAAIDGVAAGGGAELALACDFRVIRAGVKIGLPEVKLGLVPGGGGTQRLAQLIGVKPALRLITSGRLLNAEEAEHLGLVDRVAAEGGAEALAMSWASELSQCSGVALRAAKAAVYGSLGDDGYAAERDAFATCATSEDVREGVASFLERRAAQFKHR